MQKRCCLHVLFMEQLDFLLQLQVVCGTDGDPVGDNNSVKCTDSLTNCKK